MDNHFPGHQQALLKDNIVIAVLVFNEHNEELFQETFKKFDYDAVINLCEVNQDAPLGGSWDGKNFHIKYYESWTLGEDLRWHAPKEKPEGDYYWDEYKLEWIQMEECKTCGNEESESTIGKEYTPFNTNL
jgi:hypothetical protein